MPRFQKHEHLRKPAEFDLVYARRRSAADSWLIVYAKENALPFARIGLSVSRKYGGAVQRNRLRRLYKEAFRLTRDVLPTGLDIVLIPRSKDEPTLADIQHSLGKLLKQLDKKIRREAAAQPEAVP